MGRMATGIEPRGGAPQPNGGRNAAADRLDGPPDSGMGAAPREYTQGNMVRRWALNPLFLVAVVAAVGVVGATKASAQNTTSWDNDTCLECHSEPGLSTELPSGEILDLTVEEDGWHDSLHDAWDLKCILCHTEITAIPHDSPSFSDRRVYAAQKSEGCVVCHRDQEVFDDGVHAQAREKGNTQAAVCSDCHDPHYVTDPPLSRVEIPQTCRTCHAEIYDRYAESVHGDALTDGNPDVPTCTDCHGVHDTEGPTRGQFHLYSPVVCATCHADEELMAEYGIRTDVFDTYVADFHGRTITLFQEITPDQDTNAPVCISCHGVHDILPADANGSKVAQENLQQPASSVTRTWTSSFPEAWMSHYSATADEWPLVYWVRLFYRILIPVVIGGMLVYVAIDILGRWRRRKELQHG